MPRRTNEFQEVVAEIQRHLDPGATVEESAMLADRTTGTLREVDICIRGRVANQEVVVSVECRDHGRPADVTWVEQMHCKHSRLATDLLILASHSSFTAEAIKVADANNIRHFALDDIDATSSDRLFPETTSLWGKTWTLSIERVIISVHNLTTNSLENVRVYPDTALFLENGVLICTAVEMAQRVAKLDLLQQQIGKQATVDHKFVQFGCNLLELEGKRLCLQNINPKEYRLIDRFEVVAKCDITINEFPLKHGMFGSVKVAWGTGTMLGANMMVVATAQNHSEQKISLRQVKSQGKKS